MIRGKYVKRHTNAQLRFLFSFPPLFMEAGFKTFQPLFLSRGMDARADHFPQILDVVSFHLMVHGIDSDSNVIERKICKKILHVL